MGIKVTAVFTRPDTNVPFWKPSIEEYVRLIEEFGDAGKIVEETAMLGADGLTRTVVRTFVDQAARNEFRAAPVFIDAMAERNAYGTANNITVAIRSELV
jgi:hypothetical protein